MTYKEAADILDPETRIETLVGIGYYNGFNSDKAQSDAVNEACRIAAEVLRNVSDTNVGDKWVSVKDRLPEDEKIVLISCICLDGSTATDVMAFIKDGEWRWNDGLPAEFSEKVKIPVTHWMFLPDPPKSEE